MQASWYRPLIFQIANSFQLDPFLVEGVVWQESRGQADAFRYEPKFWLRYLAKLPEYKGENERRVASSYGLMQIMYVTAKEIGFDGEPEGLFVPRVNLHWGCEKLSQLFTWARSYSTVPGDEQRIAALAAYNGGRGGNTPGTDLRPDNRQYAMRVLATRAVLLDLEGEQV